MKTVRVALSLSDSTVDDDDDPEEEEEEEEEVTNFNVSVFPTRGWNGRSQIPSPAQSRHVVIVKFDAFGGIGVGMEQTDEQNTGRLIIPMDAGWS